MPNIKKPGEDFIAFLHNSKNPNPAARRPRMSDKARSGTTLRQSSESGRGIKRSAPERKGARQPSIPSHQAPRPLKTAPGARSKTISIKINGRTVSCLPGETIWQAAKSIGIEIPGLCSHPDFAPKGNCRVCVVEVKGRKNLVTSCSAVAEEGMEIITDSERVKSARNMNLELVFAEHIERCPTCIWRLNCKLLSFADKYKLEIRRFHDRKSRRKIYRFAEAVEIDGTQCIDCRNCVDACTQLQKIDYLEIAGKGPKQEIVPAAASSKSCILCGQCAVHCPVGAAQEHADWQKVEHLLARKSKIMVAQFAPSVRATIGEEFGMSPGKPATEKLVAALKELGFDYVFDVNFSADVTTMVEAEELLDRIANKGVLPMMTSCCPAWVNFVEFYHPELISHLTTARSPHMHGGGIIKTFWSDKAKVDPRRVNVVSIMPCTAKKHEITRVGNRINGMPPVDSVLTTREIAWLIYKHKVDLPSLKGAAPDSPMGEASGAAVIYGASGGVMESALRTAEHFLCEGKKKKLCKNRLEFREVRGLSQVKEADVDLGGKRLRVAVVNGIGNVEPVIARLNDYDYIEVMACPGGCIGGGGQPIPTTPEIRRKRAAALYSIDSKASIRTAHENRGVVEALQWLAKKEKLGHEVLHTWYKKAKKI